MANAKKRPRKKQQPRKKVSIGIVVFLGVAAALVALLAFLIHALLAGGGRETAVTSTSSPAASNAPFEAVDADAGLAATPTGERLKRELTAKREKQ